MSGSDAGTPSRAALLQGALERIEDLERQLEAAGRGARGEPIAIVGAACRLPGGVDSPEALWRALREGRDLVGPIPRERWPADRYFDADPDAPGKIYCRHGAFLPDVDRFDPAFFGVSQREAEAMDPQHRLLLEVAHEALERAGLAGAALAGSATGVFVGLTFSDYDRVLERLGEAAADAYHLTGNAHCFAAGRISHLLGLEGPSVAVDTACSSSLVAVHLACQSLRAGESSLALAGGVNLILSPRVHLAAAKARMLSPSGRCRTFDASADGMVRSEGCVVVALKPLPLALRDRDPVLAVIRGTAVNQDGASGGLTVPSPRAQTRLIKQALASGSVDPESVSYVEAHGTGTPLGDPVEILGLAGALASSAARRERPLLVGSLKTNFGHLESAAGVAGLLKVVLALQHRTIPPHLHLVEPNPRIDWKAAQIEIPTQPTAWRAPVRIGGVSSFGASGTNAHAVIEEAPAEPSTGERPAARPEVIVLSAPSETSLRGLAARWRDLAAARLPLPLARMARSAALGRRAYEHRAAIVARDAASAAAALARVAASEGGPDVCSARVPSGRRAKRAAFLFTGQGAQHAGMGGGLYAREPAFRAAFDVCAAAADAELGRPLAGILGWNGGAAELDRTAHAQPALFCVEYALAELLRSWGIEPEWVGGHSVGEFVAAVLAGVMAPGDAARLVAIRGRLMQSVTRAGRMLAVDLPEEALSDLVSAASADVSIAAVNGPENVVLAGCGEALAGIADRLAERGRRARWLDVSHAFHSPHMDAVLDAFESACSAVPLRTPARPMLSGVTGDLAGDEVAKPGYWRRQLRETVRFAENVGALRRAGADLALEVGPHPALLPHVLAAGLDGVATLRRDRPADDALRSALAELFVRGVAVDWESVFAHVPGAAVVLPPTPFASRRCWPAGAPLAAPAPVDPGWLYTMRWRPAGELAPLEAGARGTWLAVGEHGRCAALARAIEAAGDRCVALPVAAGEGEEALERRAAAALSEERDIGRVVYLAATSGRGDAADRAAAPLAQAAALLRALRGVGGAARLWLVTSGAQPCGGSVDAAASAAWGLARSAAAEVPDRFGGIVDVGDAAGEEDLARAARWIRCGGEDQVAMRGGSAWVPRLERTAPPPAGSGAIRGDRSYLVTGGLGRLGLRMAGWLADRGAREIALIGRRGAPAAGADPDGVLERLAELEARGVRVVTSAVDVTDLAALRAAVSALASPLGGIVHAAGIGSDRPLESLDRDALAEVIRPKLSGAVALASVARERAAEWIAFFSSAAALWGGVGQTAYAAANAALDGFAASLRAEGLRAVSVQWGLFDEAGVGAPPQRERIRRAGVLPMDADRALAGLAAALDGVESSLAVAQVDWPTLAGLLQARRAHPWLGSLRATSAGETPPARASRVADADAADAVAEEVARVLGLVSSGEVDRSRGFASLGMDSLMSLQLRRRLEARFGVALSDSAVFDHPDVERMAELLRLRASGREGAGPRAVRRQRSGEDGAIAIVGTACRLPGGVSDLESFWRLLRDGRDVFGELPWARWGEEAARWPVGGRLYARTGAFLERVDDFDAGFFHIAPREAHTLDPQQRLLLEVAWEALEDAGQAGDRELARETGVFVGITTHDYQDRLDPASGAHPYSLSGGGNAYAAGRLSYALGLQGPALSIDTACSSALVALHLACRSLREGECRAALVGGVHLMLSARTHLELCDLKALSPGGRCRAFDADADGYVRGEGCVVLAMKPLADALAAGDRVLAVVRGSAVNHDGPSSGLTVPNGVAQREVLRRALDAAGVRPQDLDLVEAHGTGTPLGDPIELEALRDAVAAERPSGRPLLVGSAKTAVGHLEAASGLVGLLKVIAALENEFAPVHQNFGKPTPRIDWNRSGLRVPTELVPWPRGTRVRRAGVSSFGMSGTNAHVIVEEAPAEAPRADAPAASEAAAPVLLLSSRTASGLRRQAERYASWLAAGAGGAAYADAAYTSAVGRSHFAERLALWSPSAEESSRALVRFAGGGVLGAEGVRGATAVRGRRKVGVLFTGQGSQYRGMGAELAVIAPVYREWMERFESAIGRLGGFSLRAVLDGAEGDGWSSTREVQPALFAVQWSLWEQWRAWGLRADAVLGHSVGEYAAACAAGVFDWETALHLVVERGRRMEGLAGTGAMLAVEAPESAVGEWLAAEPTVSLGASNGPRRQVLSGERSALERLAARAEAAGYGRQWLVVSHAFHSSQMDPLVEEFGRLCGAARLQEPTGDPVWVTNARGAEAGAEVASGAYWARQVRDPVRFGAGVERLFERGVEVLVELGPHPVLLGLAAEVAAERAERSDESESESVARVYVPTLRRGQADALSTAGAWGRLYTAGVELDWASVYADRGHRKVSLPTYAFERSRYWAEPVGSVGAAGAHPVWSGASQSVAGVGEVSEGRLSAGGVFADHRIFGREVVPAAAYVEAGLSAGRSLYGAEASLEVRDVSLERVLAMPEAGAAVRVQRVVSEADAAGERRFAVYARAEGAEQEDAAEESSPTWTSHATGTICRVEGNSLDAQTSVEDLAARARAGEPVDVESLYAAYASLGLSYGPRYRAMVEAWRGPEAGESWVRVVRPVEESEGFALSPALLDGALQAVGVGRSAESAAYVPAGIESVRWSAGAEEIDEVWVHAQSRTLGAEGLEASLRLYDAVSGRLVGAIEGLVLSRQRSWEGESEASRERALASWLYRVSWEPLGEVATQEEETPRTWWIAGDGGGVGEALRAVLRARGEQVDDEPGALHHCVYVGAVNADDTAERVGAESARIAAEALQFVQSGLEGEGRRYLVTQGAQAVERGERSSAVQASLWGLGRVAASEHPESGLVLLDLGASDTAESLADALLAGQSDPQQGWRGGRAYGARLVREASATVPAEARASYGLETSESTSGLEGLHWSARPRRAPDAGEVEIAVEATGLNFRDVMNGLGVYPGEAGALGLEVSGRVVRCGPGGEGALAAGDRVYGLAPGGFASHVTTRAGLVRKVVETAGLSMEAWASLPVAYLTALYALKDLGGVGRGTRVLLHAAAGGVGGAALQVAHALGARVYATASGEKRRALEQAPGVEAVFSSRTLEFADGIRAATGGAGVDVVLNALAGEYVDAGLSLLSKGGRFLEMGKTDVRSAEWVAERYAGVSYRAFDLMEAGEARLGELLAELGSELAAGRYRPLAVRGYERGAVREAFRWMAQARHVGKVVVRTGSGSSPAGPGAYVVTGGLGALGLVAAEWLVERGAERVVLLGRAAERSAQEPEAAARLEALRARGAAVRVASVDVRDAEALESLWAEESSSAGGVRGVIHAAGIADDALLGEQTGERFWEGMAAKVLGAAHLDALSRRPGSRPLELFVLYGSAAAVLGNGGQSSYAAANAYLAALAHRRRADGHAATAIAWGPWSGGGMASRVEGAARRWSAYGVGWIDPAAGMRVLERAVEEGLTEGVALPLDRHRMVSMRGATGLFAGWASQTSGGSGCAGRRSPARSWASGLAELPAGERRRRVSEGVAERIRSVLGLPREGAFDVHQPLKELGLDSLMAVELRNGLARDTGLRLSTTLVFNFPDAASLTEHLLGRLVPDDATAPPGDRLPGARAQLEARMRALSDRELLAEVAAEIGGPEAADG